MIVLFIVTTRPTTKPAETSPATCVVRFMLNSALIGRYKETLGMRAPSRSKLFQFHAVFAKELAK